MKRVLPILLCGLALVVAPEPARAGSVREALTGHELRDLSGAPVDLGSLDGKLVVLNFWAEWCAPCRRELPVFDRWNEELDGQQVRFVAVSIDREARKAKRMAESMGLGLPLYHDGPAGLAAELDLPALPTTYLLAADGSTIHVSSGSSDETLAELRLAIDRQLRAPVATTPIANTGADR